MNNHASQRPSRALPTSPGARLGTLAAAAAVLLATGIASAMPVVTSISGGPTSLNSKSYGYVDGPMQGEAQYHTPWGIALDNSGNLLYVADRDNNAVRQLDFIGAWTSTFATNNGVSKPVGVAVDHTGSVYVLNHGNGSNGSVIEFDSFGDPITTNAMNLVNANGIAVDSLFNIYVTVSNNVVVRIAQTTFTNIIGTNITMVGTNSVTNFVTETLPTNVVTTVGSVTNTDAVFQGLVVTDTGLLAVCDSGRNGVLLIDPNTGTNVNLTGFNGRGDQMGPKNFAKLYQPTGITKAGGNLYIVSDYGNNRVKVVDGAGTVTNLYGVSSNFWVQGSPSQGVFPGWFDGTVCAHDALGCVEARLPVGVAFAADGTVYTTEVFYDIIRKVTSTTLPPPPPPIPEPQIGWVDFPPPGFVSVLHTDQPFIFNNDVVIAIQGTGGSETLYTYGATPGGFDTVPDPTSQNGASAPPYANGLPPDSITSLPVPAVPDLTIKALGTAPGRADSAVAVARFQFKVGNPIILGNNAASFVITNVTAGAVMYYTLDGSDPTNGQPNNGPIQPGQTLSLDGSTNFTFKIRGFRDHYQDSDVTSVSFSTNGFVPNSLTFGFASGEASSDFVASPGQLFYAPVTLSTVQGTKIDSLQFNISVTNLNSSPAVAPGAVGFETFLEKPSSQANVYVRIPTAMFLAPDTGGPAPNPPPGSKVFVYGGFWFQDLRFVNTSLNLMGVGWVERNLQTNLYNTLQQDLVKFSQPHDTLFDESNFKIVPGGYFFAVPSTAVPGNTYQIQLGRPSATSDGVGAPGANVIIATPSTGPIRAIETVTIGQRKYIAGDSAPFRWFNAGDFGEGNLDNNDVQQVFEAAIYGFNSPPPGSDFFDSMDSAGTTYQDLGNGYLVPGAPVVAVDNLFDGDDTSINQVAFGDGHLDVTDVYVTFRRSLDPSLTWFRRFWTNGILAAEMVPNGPQGINSGAKRSRGVTSGTNQSATTVGPQPAVNFTAGDLQTSAGQTVIIPITAQVFGNYPLRVLLLNVSVNPLDGSPALTTPIQFNPNPALGSPTMTDSKNNGNFAGAWLDSTISGVSSNALLGTLVITIPGNATTNSSYSVTFDHASASPNGIAAFTPQHHTGLITLANRSGSSYSDGIPDSWRLRYFGTIYNLLSQASADADGDGMNNWQEYIAGTDPTDPGSFLKVTGVSGGTRAVKWPSVSGKNYLIQRSSSLFGQGWTSIATNAGTGGTMEFDDAPTGGVQFYRVQVLP